MASRSLLPSAQLRSEGSLSPMNRKTTPGLIASGMSVRTGCEKNIALCGLRLEGFHGLLVQRLIACSVGSAARSRFPTPGA
jgi:hypothetical protein